MDEHSEIPISLEMLVSALNTHKKELRTLKKMNDYQWKGFKQNLSIGCLDDITRLEAIAMLSNMMATNLRMQIMIKNGEIL